MKAPIIVYLANPFTGHPAKNTKIERDMALALEAKHPGWYVIAPHFAVDALIDGTIDWKGKSNFSQERRIRAGEKCLALIWKIDVLVLGCKPEYKYSAGVTWEYVFTALLNHGPRKDNPIKVMSYEEAMKFED